MQTLHWFLSCVCYFMLLTTNFLFPECLKVLTRDQCLFMKVSLSSLFCHKENAYIKGRLGKCMNSVGFDVF